MIKYLFKLAAMSALLISVAWMAWQLLSQWKPHRPGTAVLLGSAPRLEQIQALSHLATLNVEVTDALVFQLNGKTGGMTAVLVVRGEAVLGVDLKEIRFSEVDETRRRVALELPQPKILSASLDHQRTRVVALQSSGLWFFTPGGSGADAAVLDDCYRHAEGIVQDAAGAPELLARAKEQVRVALVAFLAGMNWTLECRWRAIQ